MKIRNLFLVILLFTANLSSGCKKDKCPSDPSFLTFEMEGKTFQAHSEKDCKDKHASLEPNAKGFFTDGKKTFWLYAHIYDTDQNEYFFSLGLKNDEILEEGRRYYLSEKSSKRFFSIVQDSISYATFPHSAWVEFTEINNGDNGDYQVEGKFEGFLMNCSRTDTIQITAGRFKAIPGL